MKRRFKTKGLKVLALFDAGSPVPPDYDLRAELKTDDWKTEAHVLGALRTLGCETIHHVLHDDLDALFDAGFLGLHHRIKSLVFRFLAGPLPPVFVP